MGEVLGRAGVWRGRCWGKQGTSRRPSGWMGGRREPHRRHRPALAARSLRGATHPPAQPAPTCPWRRRGWSAAAAGPPGPLPAQSTAGPPPAARCPAPARPAGATWTRCLRQQAHGEQQGAAAAVRNNVDNAGGQAGAHSRPGAPSWSDVAQAEAKHNVPAAAAEHCWAPQRDRPLNWAPHRAAGPHYRAAGDRYRPDCPASSRARSSMPRLTASSNR